MLLLVGLFLVIFTAVLYNLNGKFRISTWFTAPCMVLGPWLSILLDPTVLAGDFVPLVYVAMSIQLCSILLRERMTIIIALIQLVAVVMLISTTPALQQINWPSLVTFIVSTAVIGVLYGFSNKRQLNEIEKQRNQLILDEAKLRDLSVRDPLTGLYNRRYMEETFDREIQRAIRKQQPLAVIMADIDGFKNINDHRRSRARRSGARQGFRVSDEEHSRLGRRLPVWRGRVLPDPAGLHAGGRHQARERAAQRD